MDITFLDFVLLALASFRLTRLIVYDKITEFIRTPFFNEVEEANEEGEVEIYYVPKETPVKKFFGELLSCYWCTGIWVAAGVCIAYLLLPELAGAVILIFAVAGLASIIEAFVQLIFE